jgi:predicted DNA binding CopG/RHH family protein
MQKDHGFRIRLTKQDRERLEKESDKKGIPMSELIRDYIRSLPS